MHSVNNLPIEQVWYTVSAVGSKQTLFCLGMIDESLVSQGSKANRKIQLKSAWVIWCSFWVPVCGCFLIYFSFFSLCLFFFPVHTFTNMHTHTHLSTTLKNVWLLSKPSLWTLMDESKLRVRIFRQALYFRTFSLAPLHCLLMSSFERHVKLTNRVIKKKQEKKTSYVLINRVNLLSTAYEATQETEWISDSFEMLYAKSNTNSTPYAKCKTQLNVNRVWR